jgi:hypothetical protein
MISPIIFCIGVTKGTALVIGTYKEASQETLMYIDVDSSQEGLVSPHIQKCHKESSIGGRFLIGIPRKVSQKRNHEVIYRNTQTYIKGRLLKVKYKVRTKSYWTRAL